MTAAARTHDVSRTRVVPGTPADVFDRVLVEPLDRIFAGWFGPIPPIAGVDGQDGVWGTPGQTRTIRMADGGTMKERLTSVDRPDSFGYEITDVTGRMRPLVARAEGRWTFSAVPEGTRVTWSWRLFPTSSGSAVLMPAFGWFWRGYARKSLRRLEERLAG